jgi:uncharacterized protein YbbK (DUF523 family)
MKMISACLLGIRCAWSGDERYKNEQALKLLQTDILLPVCPEQLGGLPTPRPPQEIQDGTGDDVLDGKARVFNSAGTDVTDAFIRGAQEVLKIARQFNISAFIGKSGSPACGCGQIYDGSFSGRVIKGNGVTAALLRKNGVKLISEKDLCSQ